MTGETFAYYGRAWSHQSPNSVKAYVLHSMLVLVAPAFLAATMYMSLGRIVQSLDAEKHSVIRARWLTTIFVLADVICFISQIAGAGLQVTGDAQVMKTGRTVVLGGLIFQVIVFGLFVIIAWKFHARLTRDPTTISEDPAIS